MKKIAVIVFTILLNTTYAQPLAIDSITYVQPSMPTFCDGQIWVYVSGGCPGYVYDFYDPTFNNSAVCCGVYPFTVTDACSNVLYDTAYLCTTTGIQNIFQNQTSYIYSHNKIIFDTNIKELKIYNILGQKIYDYSSVPINEFYINPNQGILIIIGTTSKNQFFKRKINTNFSEN